MVKRYAGGVISATAAAPNSVTAAGIWNLSEMTQSVAANIWPLAGMPKIDYILVGGGGGGGGRSGSTLTRAGGGAGAGGYITANSVAVFSGTTYVINIGAGGAVNKGQGNDSTFYSQLAYGGGGGGNNNGTATQANASGAIGGSGGGAGTFATSTVPSAGTAIDPAQGNNGGSGVAAAGTTSGAAGGGGGAGQDGAPGNFGNATVGPYGGDGILTTIAGDFQGIVSTTLSNSTINITGVTSGRLFVGSYLTSLAINGAIVSFGNGSGGTGTYVISNVASSSATGISINSSQLYVAAGGGGGGKAAGTGPRPGGNGGLGGGGIGGTGAATVAAGAGSTNTGSGGGGGAAPAATTTDGPGGAGGSGVLYIRYPVSYAAATTTGNPTVYTSGLYRIYRFTQSGSITFNNA